MLTITDDAARRAFRAYQAMYSRGRDWGVHQYKPLWEHGRRAFVAGGDPVEFTKLYEDLRRGWLVFRPSPPTPEVKVHTILSDAAKRHPEVLKVRLSTFERDHLPAMRAVLQNAAEIKRNSGGPSLVAVSKFLHFWNPGLFVIVDNQVMDSFVFQQAWLYDEISAVNKEIAPELDNAPEQLLGPSTGFYYEAILLWASRFIRKNRNIPALFAEFAQERDQEDPDGGFAQFEAAAVEILLLGLANMPPAGVTAGGDVPPVRG
jgi:hypothetical protein